MIQNYLTATDLAEKVGTTRQTIYYYQKLGLIKPAIKTETITLYTSETIDRIKKIQELKNTYHLKAIKEKLEG